MTARQKSSILFPDRPRPKSSTRLLRVADLIKKEISLLLLHRIKDPRLLTVSIVEVTVSKDLRAARLHYSVLGSEPEAAAAKAGLLSARGFMRSHLASALDLRVTPELIFERDFSLVRQQEMEELFREIAGEPKPTE